MVVLLYFLRKLRAKVCPPMQCLCHAKLRDLLVYDLGNVTEAVVGADLGVGISGGVGVIVGAGVRITTGSRVSVGVGVASAPQAIASTRAIAARIDMTRL